MSRKFALALTLFQILLVVPMLVLAIGSLRGLSEISSAASALRYIGEISVDVQVLVKRELNNDPEDVVRVEELRAEIASLFQDLSAGNPEKNTKRHDDQPYQEELSRLYMQWKKLESMMEACRNSQNDAIHLFMLSVEFHNQSKVTLGIAERYADSITGQVRKKLIFVSILLTVLIATLSGRLYMEVRRKGREVRESRLPD